MADDLTPQDAFGKVAWPVRTERLTIRPARATDADTMWEYRRREDVSRWLSRWLPDRADWQESFTDPARLATALVIERDGEVLGDLMLRVTDACAHEEVAEMARGTQAELGWVLHPAHAGNGYGTEAASALLRVCFADLGLRRVTAGCFAENEPSWRLMERLGMRRELHAVRDCLHRDGTWHDGYEYGLLAEEWENTDHREG